MIDDFIYAIKSGLNNAFDFKGRAARHEYWYWTLFIFLISLVLNGTAAATGIGLLSGLSFLVSIVLIIPGLAVSFRRLHDIGKSAWWLLILFIPIVGFFWFLYLAVQPSDAGHNEYGENPFDRKARQGGV